MKHLNKLNICLLFCFIGIPPALHSQTLEAHYKVVQTIYNTDEKGLQKSIATLEYAGFFYQQNNRYIFFKKPLYLDKYPDGYIHISEEDNKISLFGLDTDTLQDISYIDFDSLVTRNRCDLNNESFNYKRKLVRGSITWQMLPDTKNINGLKCQKAQFFDSKGQLQWLVWFCPNIPVFASPGNVVDLPGLVVQGENKVLDETYILESYKSNVPIPANIFWPSEFNQPFK